jgi:hypothetical protein
MGKIVIFGAGRIGRSFIGQVFDLTGQFIVEFQQVGVCRRIIEERVLFPLGIYEAPRDPPGPILNGFPKGSASRARC